MSTNTLNLPVYDDLTDVVAQIHALALVASSEDFCQEGSYTTADRMDYMFALVDKAKKAKQLIIDVAKSGKPLEAVA